MTTKAKFYYNLFLSTRKQKPRQDLQEIPAQWAIKVDEKNLKAKTTVTLTSR